MGDSCRKRFMEEKKPTEECGVVMEHVINAATRPQVKAS